MLKDTVVGRSSLIEAAVPGARSGGDARECCLVADLDAAKLSTTAGHLPSLPLTGQSAHYGFVQPSPAGLSNTLVPRRSANGRRPWGS